MTTPHSPIRGKGLLLAIGVTLGLSLVMRAVLRSNDEDLARQANQFLHDHHYQPLSGDLDQLLHEAEAARVPTQDHPLLGKTAPLFELVDHRERLWKLEEERRKGPVVVIFYYGYVCAHCVGQLFAVNQDIEKFRELGARVLAISADTPDFSSTKLTQYGDFQFPVLYDPRNLVATAYGAYFPPKGILPELRRHGTFVVAHDGTIAWCNLGDQPFTDNRTLLYEVAKSEARLPHEHH